ncbi:hypothetical protein D3C73_968350 [compost metagenome]
MEYSSSNRNFSGTLRNSDTNNIIDWTIKDRKVKVIFFFCKVTQFGWSKTSMSDTIYRFTIYLDPVSDLLGELILSRMHMTIPVRAKV